VDVELQLESLSSLRLQLTINQLTMVWTLLLGK
jgi:hypothetical protein